MLSFFEDLKTFYLSNFLKKSLHHKVLNRLSNAETQFKRYETSYSLLLISNVYTSSSIDTLIRIIKHFIQVVEHILDDQE